MLGLEFSEVSTLATGLVAAALTLSSRVIYPHYAQTATPWGLTPLADQQIGGGIMWISGAIYFVIMLVTLYRTVQPATETSADDLNAPVQPHPRPSPASLMQD